MSALGMGEREGRLEAGRGKRAVVGSWEGAKAPALIYPASEIRAGRTGRGVA